MPDDIRSPRTFFNKLMGITVIPLPNGGEQRTYRDGTKKWFLDGKLHREDGPAIEQPNGSKEWYKNGKRHRDGGPAVEWFDGSKAWYRNGVLHRDDGGPAYERPDGRKEWLRNGKWDRADGPALIFGNGSEEWYKNGKLHRTDGPAQILLGQKPGWFIEGRELSERQVAAIKARLAAKTAAPRPMA